MSNAQLDALLNCNLSDIEDLPDFARLPMGAFKLKGVKSEVGETKKKEGKINFIFSLTEVVEVSPEHAADVPPVGSLTSFQYSGEFGVKKFKKIFLDVLNAANCTTISQFMDQFDSLEFLCTVKSRADKEDPTKVYSEIQTIVLS